LTAASGGRRCIHEEEVIMTHFRTGTLAVALAVVGAVVPASAQTTTTTTIETVREPLRLSPQQRTVIYRTITRERHATPFADVTIRRGAMVPPAVVLSPLPERLYVEVPDLVPLKYFYVNNQLVLVDPRTSEVVEVIDD
jgi:hypothetical protein